MRGSQIIVSANPQGKFEEGVIDDTSLPGTIMEVVPGSSLPGGRFHWRHSTATTGSPRQLAVLLDDPMQGFLPGVAYVAVSRCFLYYPLAGEDLNILTAAEPGTGSADAFTVGELVGIDNTGRAVPNSSYTATPFTVMEHLAQSPADTPTLVWMRRN